jgi:AcrR family transcriptional regulator
MVDGVKRSYDNSRREAQSLATRRRVVDAAKALFIERGYPATTLEAVAAAADTSLPTLYRLFSSKRALLKTILDVSFGGDDQPIAFADRPEVRAAREESDPAALLRAFARISSAFMQRSAAIMHVLVGAAEADPEAAQLWKDIKRQRLTGQSGIVAALGGLEALDPSLTLNEACDMVYAAMSPDVYRLLTIDRGWTAGQYERWVVRSLNVLLRV